MNALNHIKIDHIDSKTLEDLAQVYFEKYKKQDKPYTYNQIKEALEYLSYHTAKELPKDEQHSKVILYVFRHGQTEDNANFVFSGWREPHLTAQGREQALILADKIKDKKIDMLISSPQIRAMETMILAISKNKSAKDLEIQIDERIKERNYGIFQDKSKLDMQLENAEELHKIRRSWDHAIQDGESLEMVCKRVKDFCDEIVPLMQDHKLNVAVSCHGNSIRGFRKYFEHLSNEETAEIETPLGKDYLAYSL